jgi:hypothetical protein
MSDDDRVTRWLAALEERYLADLTPAEVARALRALSSCYVERRAKLAAGAALDSAGKRAAFALFYAPLHFAVVHEIVRALPGACDGVREIVDVGCGTGSSGAAWAIAADASLTGLDRHPWAVAEANWTYRHLGLRGRASRRDAGRLTLRESRGSAILAAYAANELADESRVLLLSTIDQARERGVRALIVEPISRRTSPWWPDWESAFKAWGGRSDEWRFPSTLADRQRALAKAAGLDPRELIARTLYLPGA